MHPPQYAQARIVSNELEEISNNQEAIPGDNPLMILEGIRKKCVKNIIIGHLNINALANKFDDLKVLLKDKVDILVLVETKLDDSFPIYQFIIEGYTSPYRLDRNCFGGGVMVYVRKDIQSKELKKHNLHKSIEALFVEMNLKKTKLLLLDTYHSKHDVHGTSDIQFFEQIGLALDVYSGYEKFLIPGDFNVQVGEPLLFNIYLNYLFYEFTNTTVCNLADDTTPYECDIDLPTLLHNVEHNTLSAILWFVGILAGNSREMLWAKVGEEMIWESNSEKLLGLEIDKNLNFNKHLSNLCKKVSGKVSA